MISLSINALFNVLRLSIIALFNMFRLSVIVIFNMFLFRSSVLFLLQPESVALALQILDGSEYKGHKIYVERARFELKGSFDPNKRRRKLTKQEKKKLKLKQEKYVNITGCKHSGIASNI